MTSEELGVILRALAFYYLHLHTLPQPTTHDKIEATDCVLIRHKLKKELDSAPADRA